MAQIEVRLADYGDPGDCEAALVVQRGFAMPGVLLADGSVLVLGWAQLRPLVETFNAWRALSPKAAGDEA